MTDLSRIYGVRLLLRPEIQRRLLVVVLAIVLPFRALQLLTFSTEIQWGYDLSAYLQASRHVLDGQAIYNDAQLAGPYAPQAQFLYLYPPFLAVAMAPVAAIVGTDHRVVNWLWAAVGLLIAIVITVAMARRERIVPQSDRWLLVGVVLAFPPVIGELVMGNVHLVLLGLLGGAWLAVRRGDRAGETLAGVLVGIAILIKVFPVVILLWFLGRQRWAALLAATATMAALALATLPVVGLQPWLDYPIVILNQAAPTDAHDALAPSVWLATIVPGGVARAGVLVAVLAAVAWTARRRAEVVSFAVAVATSVLAAPALYHHYLALFVFPLLVALRWARPLGWTVVAYLLMFGGEQAALGDAQWIVNRVLPTLGALLLTSVLVIRGAALEGEAGAATA